MDIKELGKEVHQIAVDKGFWDEDRNFGEMIALVHAELSEALEADREDAMDNKLPHRKGVEVELADAIIRILDMGEGLGLDLEGAIREKINYNSTRPHKHGKKY